MDPHDVTLVHVPSKFIQVLQQPFQASCLSGTRPSIEDELTIISDESRVLLVGRLVARL